MTVLVTAASEYGATREIAEEIARVLDEHGVATELLDIDDVTDLSSYEAYVVGSGSIRRCFASSGSSPRTSSTKRSAASRRTKTSIASPSGLVG